MKVVVSGSSGFLGGHTLSLLKRNNIDALGTSRSTSNIVKDIIRIDSFNDMPEADILVHFSESNNRFEVNAQGPSYIDQIEKIMNILIKKYNRIIYASSVAVYPDNLDGLRNPTEKITPIDTYAKSKLLMEDLILNKNSVVARIGNAYGPGMSHLNVISSITKQFLQKQSKIELVSTDPIRDFIWYDDIAAAFLKMCLHPTSGIYNVATGIGHSILEVCKIVEDITNHKNYEIVTQKKVTNSNIIMDIHNTADTFDWVPQVQLKQGLSMLIKGDL